MDIVSAGFLLFCGALLTVYYRVPGRFQWPLLLAASCLFYAGQGYESLAYLLFTTLTTYGTGLLLGSGRPQKKRWLALCLTANFALLFLCKVELLRGGLLPLGISFYLFQSMGYLMDVSRGSIPPERHIGKLALFISFFPQLIQGPISRADQLLPQLTAPHAFDGKQVSFGLQRMLWGYFKKLVIAQRLAPAVLSLRASGSALLLSILYALQLYGDFTGGIDIALGLSQAMGIRLPENFRRPFFSKNTAEFWRRWHITLGEWMRNYIFYPVSISRPLRRLGRFSRKRLGKFGRRLPVYAASLVTWAATGIWHGLTPNFLLWGLMNFAVITLSEELSPLYARFHRRYHLKERRWYGAFEILRTFLLMNLIRICDLFPDVTVYFHRLGGLFAPVDFSQLGLSALDWGILAGSTLLLIGVSVLQERRDSVRQLLWQRHWLLRYCLIFGLFLTVLLLGCYGIGYDASSFIYSQF